MLCLSAKSEMLIYLAKTRSIKIHFDNVFLSKQKNLIHAVINKWPNQLEIQHLEKFKVKVPWTSQSYFKQ